MRYTFDKGSNFVKWLFALTKLARLKEIDLKL
jgi:hypothetical protein